MYAIYYAFVKFEYLIRDVHFPLRTDHKNLTYLNTDNGPKVKRWKLAIQEYGFDIEYLTHFHVYAQLMRILFLGKCYAY